METKRHPGSAKMASRAIVTALLTLVPGDARALSVEMKTALHGTGSYDQRDAVPVNAKIWIRVCVISRHGLPSTLWVDEPPQQRAGWFHVALLDERTGSRLPGSVVREASSANVFRIEPNAPLAPDTPHRVELYDTPLMEDPAEVKLQINVATRFSTGPSTPSATTDWQGPQGYDVERKAGFEDVSHLRLGAAPPVFMVTPSSPSWPLAANGAPDFFFADAQGSLASGGVGCRARFPSDGAGAWAMHVEPVAHDGMHLAPWWVRVHAGEVTAYRLGSVRLGVSLCAMTISGALMGVVWRRRRRRAAR